MGIKLEDIKSQEELDKALEEAKSNGAKALQTSIDREKAKISKSYEEEMSKLRAENLEFKSENDKRQLGEKLKGFKVKDKFISDVISKGELSIDLKDSELKSKMDKLIKDYPEYVDSATAPETKAPLGPEEASKVKHTGNF